MPSIVSITQQGQVTIPKNYREQLNIKKNSKAVVEQKGNSLVVTPIEDFFALRGSIKPISRPENFKKMRKAFIKHLAKNAMKNT